MGGAMARLIRVEGRGNATLSLESGVVLAEQSRPAQLVAACMCS